MDLARAIHKIDSKAEFRLNHSQADGQQQVVEWRGPSPEPSKAELDTAWLLCEADDESERQAEQEQQEAMERIQADPALQDVAIVLGQ